MTSTILNKIQIFLDKILAFDWGGGLYASHEYEINYSHRQGPLMGRGLKLHQLYARLLLAIRNTATWRLN